ncbi:putative metal-dependent enzyme (double-stranded beta helix superfamily) [Saccharopolyspora erythraea NRRL 2338]|uniref:Cysteine dioxygenase type I n=2 Tax=Saccharopolyspora erythraea TaxID=1836 RepID=A4F6M4_SACEN|nr:cysteine dioxygenase family protein [Saccharopolyspora erythraea]EQD87295.1 cysteine dioxygenase [Saccharopolyspora erythraea D]PFG93501.1 putative metal-dependent enzyme (double-stranded beta helix superfamily) [Saccharopolyspora erythraea NRRL 2338]QRK90363.1 cysteine dioxygenase family protein [Saccharopolyspora erythraea]CAL99698.1 cysteine dioxygenase type I [Saccharopolyspora erythraea NRRL 2338]
MTPQQIHLVQAIRDVVRREERAERTAELVAEALRPFLAVPDLLREDQRTGDPGSYTQHVLHVEPDGSFSVVALVWLPGQRTPVHDHVAWCVTGVYEGVEHEQRFTVHDGSSLVPTQQVTNPAGDVCGFAPPGDIHLVRNACTTKAISLHVYGADIGTLGTSVRRTYDLPVRAAV